MATIMDSSLQAMDVFEIEMIIKNADGSKSVVGTGETSKTELTQKATKVEIRNGIGQVLRATLKTKKENSLKATVNKFDLDIFAAKNGVKLDKTSKKTIFWLTPTTVTTAVATLTGATRVLVVETIDGKRMDMIATGTPTEGQVLVESNKLTFVSGFSGTQVLVTYEGTTTKNNLTIVFNAKTFAKSMEVLCHSVVYAEETEDIIGDTYYDFYKCGLVDDYTLTFDGGKVSDIDLEFDITVPTLLPDGTINSKSDTGVMYVTER